MKVKQESTLVQERKLLLNEAESVAHMGSWRWTEKSNELVGTEGLHKLFNKTSDETISWNTFLEDVLPEDILLVENCLNEARTNGNGFTIDYRVTKDDHVRYLSLIIKPHDKLTTDILGAVVDITERKEHEKKLESLNVDQFKIIQELDEKEKKYRSLFERSIDPIFLANKSFELLDTNNSFDVLFNYDNQRLPKVHIKDLFAEKDDYNQFKKILKDKGQIRDFEATLLTKIGDPKTCVINCVFIPDQSSELYSYQCIIHDLSFRKQAEIDMILAERLALTGKIARTIAHEVRNPLTNLNLALDQLRTELEEENEQVKDYVGIIERNVLRIEQLVTEMLNSSRPKQLNLKLTEVYDVLKDAIRQASDRIQLNSISLHTNYQDNLPRILIDKEKIQIALLNIIINAIEACEPDKGVITIEAAVKDSVLVVSIGDNGRGIAPNDLTKLFDPFFTGKKTGMGLGLTSAKNILNSHSVTIEVKSEVDKGTTFYLHFKLSE